MGWMPSLFAVLVFANGIVLTSIGVFALRERPDPMAWPLAVLTFAGAGWAIPQAISYGFADETISIFIQQLIVPGQNLVPAAYFIFALRYAGYDRYISRRLYAAMSIFPIITLATAWTQSSNGLLWQSVRIETVGSASVFVAEYGPWYWVNLTYVYLLIGTALVVFGSVILRSEPIHRKQSLLMFVGGVVPTVVNALFTAGFESLGKVDLTTTALAVSGITFAVALFRYDSLELSPTAYRNVSEIFGDGVLVFDDSRRLVESNANAEQILDTDVQMRTAADDIFEEPLETIDGTVLSAPGNQFYIARYSQLSGHRDDTVGHVVVMRNITDLKEHEQRLSVTNRILRHNLRNELNIISGHAAMLETELPEYEQLQQIQTAANRLEAVGEKARHIQSWMDRADESLQGHDIVPVLETVLDRYREQYPSAEITLDTPDTVAVLAYDTEQLETVIDNAVENALEHHDRSEPMVDLRLDVGDDTVTLSITDDGPGIAPGEHRMIDRGTETKLRHGSSLGLWVIYWLTAAMNGTVEFEDNEPRGTVVEIQLQRP